MVSSSPSDMSEKHMLKNILDIPQRNGSEQLIAAPNNIPNGGDGYIVDAPSDPQQFHLECLSKKNSPATPSGKPQEVRPPRSTGHARFRRPFACKNIEEASNGPNPNLQLNKNGGCNSDNLKRCNVEMRPADQNVAAKRLKDQNLRQIFNGGTSSSNPTNAMDTQISNAGKNLNTPALELAIAQPVGGSPKPDAPKVQQLSSTDAATTVKALQLPNVGTAAPNFISNNVSGTQPALHASTQPGVSIKDNASKGKRVLEEYRGWSSCPTTNANLESLMKRHREMYSNSNSDMQRLFTLLSKFSGPKTDQAPVVSGFNDSNQSLVIPLTDAATTVKALQLPNVGTSAPNLISNNVSGTQPAPNASTQPGVSIRDNASKGKRVHEEYKGSSSCPTTNANLESLMKRHRQMYSNSNSDMQRLFTLLPKLSGPKTNHASVVSRFGDSNRSLVHKPKAQGAMLSSSLISNALANLDMNLGAQPFLPSQASGFSGWVNPRAPIMTYADLERRLGVINPMGPFPIAEELMSASELAVGPSSSNQMENVEERNAGQQEREEENGEEELDLDLKL